MSEPKYLYKILDKAPPHPLPQTLSPTDLDTEDGFIHLSTAEQTPITAKLFFSHCTELWVLMLDRPALDGIMRYSTDPAAGIQNGCAHLHESRSGLGGERVVDVIEVKRAPDEDWTRSKQLLELDGSI